MTKNYDENATEIQVIHGGNVAPYHPVSEKDMKAHKEFRRITLLVLILNMLNFFFVTVLGIYSSIYNASGMEFILLFYAPILYVGYALAVVYVIYFPYYLLRYKQRNGSVKLGVFVFIAVLCLFALQMYVSNTQENSKAAADKVMTVSEAESLLETCNVKSVDEGIERFLVTAKGDVTYFRLKMLVPGEGTSLERYAKYSDFDRIRSKAEQVSEQCGGIEIYDRGETLLRENRSYEYAQ